MTRQPVSGSGSNGTITMQGYGFFQPINTIIVWPGGEVRSLAASARLVPCDAVHVACKGGARLAPTGYMRAWMLKRIANLNPVCRARGVRHTLLTSSLSPRS